MSDFTPKGRLATWDGQSPDLRAWSDEELLDGLTQLNIDTDRERFGEAAKAATSQAALEDTWLETSGVAEQGLQVFLWMSVQELWERWQVDAWPRDRMARMFAYLVDAEFAHEWASRCHAPTGGQVMTALNAYLAQSADPKSALDELVELLGMPAAAWPSKLLDAMAEWIEVGNGPLADSGGELMATVLGKGHAQVYLAASYMTVRLYDRAQKAALTVPHDAPVDDGFSEMIGYLCLAAGSGMSAKYWLNEAPGRTQPKAGELTFAAETCRNFIKDAQALAGDVPEKERKAALQAASQSCFYAVMAFAGM
ncbi:MAG TPA: hypothetical protein DCQ06_04590 [Myxococcales bacterium]|nr:hypothetical protein [Myxococcales bacterium]HAN30853.1 hypothetical protein [Myxococcales bacterium]|tara:strand:- start:262 stop:1191 length:930 start_codon:yes stop_codon:yes gene_type:complete